MNLFYQPDLSADTLQLSEEESKHCVRVLRMHKGDEIDLADGKGMHAKGLITDDHAKACKIQIVKREHPPKTRNYYLHMMVAPTKNADRMEWFIEKATEVGIDEITFIETENSERSKINLDRCEKIALSAMKQSKQWYLPKINPIVKLNEALHSVDPKSMKLMAWCETPTTETIQIALQKQTNVPPNYTFLIGPEGDFTASEVELAAQKGFTPVSLGNSILRTETAALYVCMIVR